MKRKFKLFILLLFMFIPVFVYADWKIELPFFDHVYYADNNEDIYDEFGYDKDKLRSHWKSLGIKEGRPSSPVFHVRYYLEKNEDVAQQVGRRNYAKALEHYHDNGIREGRVAHPEFNIRRYIEANPDVREKFGEDNYRGALMHYVKFGRRESRPLN